MIGVFAFYSALIDSRLEKKIAAYLHTIVPRFNKRALYYLYKLIYFSIIKKLFAFIPSAKTQHRLEQIPAVYSY